MALAADRVLGRLEGLDEAAGQVPHALLGLAGAAQEQVAAVALDPRLHRGRRVLVVDEAAGVAVRALGILGPLTTGSSSVAQRGQ